MTDPRRLLEDSGLTESERRALVAAQDMQPPPGLARSSWAALASVLGPPPGTPTGGGAAPAAGGGAAAAGSAAGGGTSSLLGKLAAVSIAKAVGIGAAVGGLVTTAMVALPAASSSPSVPRAAPMATGEPQEQRHSMPHRSAPDAVPAAGAFGRREGSPSVASNGAEVLSQGVEAPSRIDTSAPGSLIGGGGTPAPDRAVDARGVSRAEPTNPLPDPGTAPSVAAFEVPRAVAIAGEATQPPPALHPSVQEEARLVGRAREALRGGDAALALQKLEKSRARFPNGALMQEREALAIEALVRLGRRDIAAERAARFVWEFPRSPYSARVQSFVGER